MGKPRFADYAKPKLERFGTLRSLTQVGCTAGGDGIWICRVAEPGEPQVPPPVERS